MNRANFEIEGRTIGEGNPPYVICELSANHGGNISTALDLVRAAAQTGADAIKIQTYTPDTITMNVDNEDFTIRGGLWDGRTLYELYKEAHTPWEWHAEIFKCARDLGVTVFSSPFDNTAVDLLEDLGAPAYKIASFEAVDIPLIRYAASTGKPLIISTGMATENEIREAIDAAVEGGCSGVAILRCVSGYPAPPEDYNLATIPDMISRFGVPVGLSDHTLDNTTAVASVAMGACIVEKHFTLDRGGNNPDDAFSLDPEGFSSLCRDLKTTHAAVGRVNYSPKRSERGNLKFRRSLYFTKALGVGDEITANDIKSVRPGYGLAPKYLDELVGRKLKKSVEYGQPTTWEVFE